MDDRERIVVDLREILLDDELNNQLIQIVLGPDKYERLLECLDRLERKNNEDQTGPLG
jgi:hypothetical protein